MTLEIMALPVEQPPRQPRIFIPWWPQCVAATSDGLRRERESTRASFSDEQYDIIEACSRGHFSNCSHAAGAG
jgi:hypothetical protein